MILLPIMESPHCLLPNLAWPCSVVLMVPRSGCTTHGSKDRDDLRVVDVAANQQGCVCRWKLRNVGQAASVGERPSGLKPPPLIIGDNHWPIEPGYIRGSLGYPTLGTATPAAPPPVRAWCRLSHSPDLPHHRVLRWFPSPEVPIGRYLPSYYGCCPLPADLPASLAVPTTTPIPI